MAPGFRTYKQSSASSVDAVAAPQPITVGKQTLVSSQYGTIAAVTDESHAARTFDLAFRIVRKDGRGLAHGAPRPAVGALMRLEAAVSDHDGKLTLAERLVMFDEAIQALAPAAAIVKQTDDRCRDLHDMYYARVEYERGNLVRLLAHEEALAARKRVDDATLDVSNKIIDVPTEPLDDRNARRYAAALDSTIVKVIKNANKVTSAFEKVVKRAGDKLDDTPELAHTITVLKVIKLSIDLPDAVERLNHHSDDVGETIRDYAHFVKVGIDTAALATKLTAKLGATLATRAKNIELARQFTKIAKDVPQILGGVASAAEAIQGIVQLADPDSSLSERIDGVVAATTGILGVISALGKAPGIGLVATGISGLYEGMKRLLVFQAEVSRVIVVAGLVPRFDELVSSAIEIQRGSETLVKACQFHDQATDDRQRTAFETVVVNATRELDSEVDGFLYKCVRIATEVSATKPGENPHMREKFAPLRSLRGASATPEAALGKALAVVNTIIDVLDDAPNYVRLGVGLDRKPRYD
jgi:hypothetical protein